MRTLAARALALAAAALSACQAPGSADTAPEQLQSLAQAETCGSGLRWVTDTEAFEDIQSAGNAVSLSGDDAWSSSLSAGFSFPYFDATVTTLRISTNGMLALGSYTPSYSNYCLPYSGAAGVVAAYWDDLCVYSGYVWKTTRGSAPNRRTIVQWRAYTGSSCGSGSLVDFQAILFESGAVGLRYKTGFAGTASSATIGLESNDGSESLQYSCGTSKTLSGLSLRTESGACAGRLANMATARATHGAALLGNGDLLVAGGGGTGSETFALSSRTWTAAGSLPGGRSAHTTTTLPDGRVLVVGGADGATELASALLWDPATRAWSAAAAMDEARQGHTATLLRDGRVLVAGGMRAGACLASARIYNPATNAWASAGPFSGARAYHTATLLADGKVLLAGGTGDGANVLGTSVLFDPGGPDGFSDGPALATPRRNHTATLLNNGDVLLAGGQGGSPIAPLASSELYRNTTPRAFQATAALTAARFLHSATAMPDGTVWVVGGMGAAGALRSVEKFAPSTGTWSGAGDALDARWAHTATLLPTKQLVLAGGLDAGNAKLATAEALLFTGTADANAKPVIASAPATIAPGETLVVTGTKLRGLTQGGSGHTQDSPSDLPVLSLTAGASTYWLRGASTAGSPAWSGVSATIPCSVPLGSYSLAAVVNGVASDPRTLVVGGLGETAPCACNEACQGSPPAGGCHGGTGTCSAGHCVYPHVDAGTDCNDGNPCTRSDTCDGAGTCAGQAYTCTPNACQSPPASGSACNGDGSCTFVNKPSTTVCTDGDPCTGAGTDGSTDYCDGQGRCVGAPKVCHTPPVDAQHPECTDATHMRVYDKWGTCVAGACQYTSKVIDCSSCNVVAGNPTCTNPCAGVTCNTPPSACFNAAGTCVQGACDYTLKSTTSCNDGDSCTSGDACNAAGLCRGLRVAQGTTCSDSNGCTRDDRCGADGACTGVPYSCRAVTQCEQSVACDGQGGCTFTYKSSTTACNDNDLCTRNDLCDGYGTCEGTPFSCSTGQCDLTATCNGSACVKTHKPRGTVCDDQNDCTTDDRCDADGGTDGTCSGGDIVCRTPPNTKCWDSYGACSAGQCQYDRHYTGAWCDDGDPCTVSDQCDSSGNCVSTPMAPPEPQCQLAGTGHAVNGLCVFTSKPDNTVCDDQNDCTGSDKCRSGACIGTPSVTCRALDQCHDVGVCDPYTGTCSNPEKWDTTPCNDNDKCTTNDRCTGGVCDGTPVTCNAPDQCHTAGSCNPATGACDYPKKANGTACNDNNACTQTDTCQNGVCTGTNPRTCNASDACHQATCNPASGCVETAKPEGASCNDGNQCTRTDTCRAGQCKGSNPVTCAAKDQCHAAGTCNPATGACSEPPLANGTTCNDGNPCTENDTCQAGACESGTAKDCGDTPECNTAPTCDPESGECVSAPEPDGTSCHRGTCVQGRCETERSGCGCGAGGAPGALALAALGLALRRRRRG